jgi:hypothetical protein
VAVAVAVLTALGLSLLQPLAVAKHLIQEEMEAMVAVQLEEMVEQTLAAEAAELVGLTWQVEQAALES